jgi:hypothetical protein
MWNCTEDPEGFIPLDKAVKDNDDDTEEEDVNSKEERIIKKSNS